ncbi:hypothetical protein ACHAW5_011337 [Stephanodiscus triporus]|uniref:Uncharacterized protein n=1 Tax=Stephanodiscus triporus TaxID=2934178 RepID=A0ABD3QR58_9STRA
MRHAWLINVRKYTVAPQETEASGCLPHESLRSSSQTETLKSLLESAFGREEKAKGTVRKLQAEVERLTDLIDKNEIAIARKK